MDMLDMDEYLKTHADKTPQRLKAHFNKYIEFRHTCIEDLGISESDVPTMWVAYHLSELKHTIGSA